MSRPGRWSTDALNDLAEQIVYIASESPSAARRVADALDKTALSLGDMPIGRPGASAFNPVLTDSDGKLRNKRNSVLLPRGHRLSAQAVQCDGVVPLLTGAALMVRADAFFQVGGFDSATFLYHEDDDLSIRLEAFGPLRIVGAAKVKHEGGHGPGDRIASASIKAFHMGQSRVYAMRKHNRPMPLLRSLGRATLQPLSPATWISRRKRTKQVNFLRGILSTPWASDAST